MTLIVSPLDNIVNKIPAKAPEVILPRSTFEAVRHNAYRLSGLISDLLDLTKGEIGKARVSPTEISDTAGYFRKTFESVAPLMEEKGLRYEFVTGDQGGGLAPHYFDTAKLDKVVVNLLSNALKFTAKGGKITMRVWDEARIAPQPPLTLRGGEEIPLLKFSVEDTGIGIPADKVSQVFERFMQVDASSTRAYTGMGIGLSLVKDFVEQHGGTVEVESEVGKGTKFTVMLPRGKEHFKAMIVEQEVMAGGVGQGIELPKVSLIETMKETVWKDEDQEETQGPKIEVVGSKTDTVLVVDDTPDMRQAVREVLKDRYRVIFAADGEEGVQKARERRPDLIISDVMMPKKDGYGLLQDLKGNPDTKEIPIILLTAKSGEENLALGFQFGADDYIAKPFQPKEVLSRTQNLIRLRRQNEEIIRQRDELERINRELKETEAELVQTEKLSTVGILAAGVAHEINNPAYALTLNLANLESLVGEVREQRKTEPSTLDGMEHHLKRSQQEIDRIKSIVKTLLTYSQKNRTGVTTSDLDLDIESTLVLLKTIIHDAGTTVHWEKGKSPVRLEADHGGLNQVLTNILQNSIQAGAKNIWMEVTSEGSGDDTTCKIRMTDDGCGIAADVLPRIFEPFFTTKEVGKGSGLGLNIVYRIVKRHHGEVTVTSTPGHGAEFVVLLPLKQPMEEHIPQDQAQALVS